MNPEFTQMRLMGSAKSHMIETMQDGYRLLGAVHYVSDQRDEHRKAVHGAVSTAGNMSVS